LSIENIGLAFSGGGFRAASFALGTMSYLEHLDWQGKSFLAHASFISSTSGGSITNAFYTLRLYQGAEPKAIFQELYALLASDEVLNQALLRLTNPKAWAEYPHKTRNLINAFAITYDKLLFDGKNLGHFWNKAHQPHVEEICFNATELNNGISFRFRTNGTDGDIVNFGNYYLGFKKEAVEALKSLRIADMVAASSCFPVGFEPIEFPRDFAADDQTPESLMAAFEFDHNNDLYKDKVQSHSFGLIDGGVVDNQGLYSLGLEDNLRPKKRDHVQGIDPRKKEDLLANTRPFDLLIVCDVASYFLHPYHIPDERKAWWSRIHLKWILIALALIVPLTIATVAIFAVRNDPWYYYLLLLPAYLSSGLIGLAFGKAIQSLRNEQSQIHGKMLGKYIGRLLNLPLSKFIQFLEARVLSFAQLALDVYLKQIRRLHLDKAYRDKGANLRLVSNFIYELAEVHRERRGIESRKPENIWWPTYAQRLQPSIALEKTAEAARNVSTTLWFDAKDRTEIDAVLATGQFTTCYNLIRYLCRLETTEGTLPPGLATLRETLLTDWAKFQADPKWMVKQVFG
jgi:hypothetical protein